MAHSDLYQSLRPPKATRFDGVTYRSRSEAKWALVLTRLEVAFTYEPETFRLASGFYTPDFWLPELDSYLEVKPQDVIDGRLSELGEVVAKRIYVANGDLPYISEGMAPASALHNLRGRLWLKWPHFRPDQALVREHSGRINIEALGSSSLVNVLDPAVLAAYREAIHYTFTSEG